MGSQSPPVPINGKFYVGMCIRCYSASCFSNKSPPPVTRRGWWESLSSLGTDQRLQRHTLEESPLIHAQLTSKKGWFPINLLFISEKSHNFVTSNSDSGPPYLRLTQGSAPTLVRLKCVWCASVVRLLIEQQSNNNRTTIGQQWKEERRKGLGRMGQKRSWIGKVIGVLSEVFRKSFGNLSEFLP